MKTIQQYKDQLSEWRDAVHNANMRAERAKRERNAALADADDIRAMNLKLQIELTKAIEGLSI